MRKKDNHTLYDEIYRAYSKRGGTLTSRDFRLVCSNYNQECLRHIIEHGRALDMGHGLSSLSIVKVERNFSRPSVDWGLSNALKAELTAQGKTVRRKGETEGENWLVYRTDPEWFKFHWRKTRCRIPNKALWKFVPSRGRRGTHTRLISFLKEDPVARTRFDTMKSL